MFRVRRGFFSSMSDSDSRKIFVGGLSLNTTQSMLSQYFGSYGAIEDAIVMTDKITGRPRGFGFVTFKDHEAVEKVLLEAHSIDGRTVECKRAVPLDQQTSSTNQQPTAGSSAFPSSAASYGNQQQAQYPVSPYHGSQHQHQQYPQHQQQQHQQQSAGASYGGAGARPVAASGGTLSQRAVQADGSLPGGEDSGYNPKKIFAGGLPASCDEAKLRSYFSKYGGIVDCVVMIDRVAQRHRGFGYVTFEDPKSVDQCMAEHDSHQIDGKWIDVKRCVIQDPAQRKQQGYPTQAAGPIRRRTDGTSPYGPGGVGAMGDAAAPGYYYNAPPVHGAHAAYASYGAHPHAHAGAYGAAANAAAYGAAGAAMYGAYGASRGPASGAGPAGGMQPSGLYTGPAGQTGQAGMAGRGPATMASYGAPSRGGATAGGYMASAAAGGYNAYYAQAAAAAHQAAGANPYYGGAAGGYGGAAGGYAGYGGRMGEGGYAAGGAGTYGGYGYGAGAAAQTPAGAKPQTQTQQPGSPGYRGAAGGSGTSPY